MRIIIYEDGSYRGGHYFDMGKDWEKKHGEYWECPSCYWGRSSLKEEPK